MTSALDLPPHLVAKAREELGEESPSFRQEKIAMLREMVAALPEKDQLRDVTDSTLVRFLRSRKYDIDKALEGTVKLRHFYDRYGDVLSNLCESEEERTIFKSWKDFLAVIKGADPQGRVVIVMRPKKGLAHFTPELLAAHPRIMLRFNVWMFDRLSSDPEVQVNGVIIMNTFNGMTLYDNFRMNSMAPMSDQLATFEIFQIIGMRLSRALIFEQPMVMTTIFFLVRPFLSAKLRDRFNMYGNDYSVLDEVIPDKARLPEVLGGQLKDDDSSYDWVGEQLRAHSEGR